MDQASKRGLLVALLIAGLGLGACVVRTAPTHRHRGQSVEHQKHKKAKKVKHKKHKHH